MENWIHNNNKEKQIQDCVRMSDGGIKFGVLH